MNKKELQKAQNIIDTLFYDDKELTQWQHNLLENVISLAQTKLQHPDVSSRKDKLIDFLRWYSDERKLDYSNPHALVMIDKYLSLT